MIKLEKKYCNCYLCQLPQQKQNETMKEIKKVISTLLLTEEEKAEAIDNAECEKICNLTDTIDFEWIGEEKTMINYIKDDNCWNSADYVEQVTGSRPIEKITLKELENMELDLWNYPLTEIEHIIENEISVVLVRFPDGYGGYEYRFCEIPTED